MNSAERFSTRHGFESDEAEITVRQDAPAGLRSALVGIAYEAGLSPTKLRQVVCQVLRVDPDSWNWSDFPNVDEEVRRRLRDCAWYEVYDVIEAISRTFGSEHFEREINKYFRKAGIGWQLMGGEIQVRGPETFNRPVADAIEQLDAAGLPTARNELHEALQDMSRRPEPDLTGALQHALAALECVAREVCGDPRPTLGQLLSRYPGLIPAPVDQAIEKIWGYASEQGRHLREGRQPDHTEVELVVGLAATVAGYLVSKLRR